LIKGDTCAASAMFVEMMIEETKRNEDIGKI